MYAVYEKFMRHFKNYFAKYMDSEVQRQTSFIYAIPYAINRTDACRITAIFPDVDKRRIIFSISKTECLKHPPYSADYSYWSINRFLAVYKALQAYPLYTYYEMYLESHDTSGKVIFTPIFVTCWRYGVVFWKRKK